MCGHDARHARDYARGPLDISFELDLRRMRVELTEEELHVSWMIKEAMCFCVVSSLALASCFMSRIWLFMC